MATQRLEFKHQNDKLESLAFVDPDNIAKFAKDPGKLQF